MVLGKLGPGRLGPRRFGGKLGPALFGAQFAIFWSLEESEGPQGYYILDGCNIIMRRYDANFDDNDKWNLFSTSLGIS